jgi:hypothetical protein
MWMVLAILMQTAFGFELSQSESAEELRWMEMPIQWSLDTADAPEDLSVDGQHDAINEAFDTWAGVPGTDISFENITGDAGQPQNVVYWETEWKADPNIVALTTTRSTESGIIIGFTIAINAAHPSWSIDSDAGMDLQNAITHEIGHVLGLDHTHEESSATMFASAIEGEHAKRDLHWDDKDGARYLYPIIEAGPWADLAMSCSTAGFAPTWLFSTLPLLMMVRRRRA